MTRPIATLLLTGLLSHGQAQETIQYGPWQGYWIQARLSAYSPHDALDKAYHETKGERWRWITADGRTDTRVSHHGIAAPSGYRFGQRIFIPRGLGYLDESRPDAHGRVFAVDDRGSAIESGSKSGTRAWLDLRYRTEYSALAFGIKDAWVFIITSDAKPPSAEMK